MPTRERLTEKLVRDAIPAEGRDYQIFDDDIRGFAVCVYRGGGRAFTFDYRVAGRQRRLRTDAPPAGAAPGAGTDLI